MLLPQPSFAVQIRVIMFVQPTVFVVVCTLGVITPAQASVNTGTLKFGVAGHSIVALAPCAVVTAGEVVSTTVITWLRFVLLPQPSFAVQVRVMRFVQPTVFVVVWTLGVITPAQASVNTGAVKFGVAGHSIVAFAPCAVVTDAGVVSITVITWLRFVLLPQPSFAVHVRVMMFVQPTVFVVVCTLGVITPAQASVNTGAVKLGVAGHSIVAFAPCAVVTAGGVVSITVIT